MLYLLIILILLGPALQAMDPKKIASGHLLNKRYAETAESNSTPGTPDASNGPTQLHKRQKLIHGDSQIIEKQWNLEGPLHAFMPIEDLRRLIAQYACEWVFCHEFRCAAVPCGPTDFKFSQAEDCLITIEDADHSDNNQTMRHMLTARNLKTKELVHKQPTQLGDLSKLSCYGEYLVNFPRNTVFSSQQFKVTALSNGTTQSWPENYNLPATHSSSCSDYCDEKNSLIASGAWEKIFVSQIQTKEIRAFVAPGYMPGFVAISPNCTWLATHLYLRGQTEPTAEAYIAIFKIQTTEQISIPCSKVPQHKTPSHSHESYTLLFSPNSKTLVIYLNHIYFYNLETHEIKKFDPQCQVGIKSASFSHDGKLFATTNESETVIWSIDSSGQLKCIQSIEHNIQCQNKTEYIKIALSPSGKYMAIEQYNYAQQGVIALWKNNGEDLVNGSDEEYNQSTDNRALPLGEQVKK